MSAWKEYKQKLGTTRPWDMVNPNVQRTSEAEAERRYSICEACPRFVKLTKQCKECGCFMNMKTKLAEAVCPIGKW
jgi:hypothetical protein